MLFLNFKALVSRTNIGNESAETVSVYFYKDKKTKKQKNNNNTKQQHKKTTQNKNKIKQILMYNIFFSIYIRTNQTGTFFFAELI